MVWKAEGVRGAESAKVRFDLVPYARGRAIDIGCGKSKVFQSFLGVDNCLDNILFRDQVKPDMVVETAERLGVFADGSFDCVFSSHTLDRIEDWRAALAEWWRITKVGGRLILYLQHADLAPPARGIDEKHRFVPGDILAAMRELGGWDLLVNERRDQADEFSFLLVFKRRDDRVCNDLSIAPKPEKTLALVRLGAFGDSLWMTSVLPHLKAQGYHITVYTQDSGELILRSDPNVDEIITMPDYLFEGINLVVYWLHETPKYDRFINLVGSVESRLLPTVKDFEFYWSDEVRRRVMNHNYLQTVHLWCGLPYEVAEDGTITGTAPRVKFHPTPDERARALERRAAMPGHVVVLNPAGSGQYKWWPHAQRFMDLMAERGVHCVVVGDNAGPALKAHPKFGHLVGRTWGMRDALAFAQTADVVVGTESAIVNAVSFEPIYKVVILSHSTVDNLTRDWVQPTTTINADGLACYPCHRIHMDMTFCTQDETTRAAACQAAVKPDTVAAAVFEYLTWLDEQKDAA